MDFVSEKRRIFSITLTKYIYVKLKIKGSIEGKDIDIICLDNKNFILSMLIVLTNY